MTPLTRDCGPSLRARQRAEREKQPDWFERNGFKSLLWGGLFYLASALAYASYALAIPTLGYVKTCNLEIMDCTPVDPATVALTPELISDLEALRAAVTYRFVPRADTPDRENDAWDTSRKIVDCSVIGLFYLQELLAQGYERGALRFGQGQTWNGERHLFLIVFTDQGPLTIDADRLVMLDRLDLKNIHVESHEDCTQQRGCSWVPVYSTETYVATMQDRTQ